MHSLSNKCIMPWFKFAWLCAKCAQCNRCANAHLSYLFAHTSTTQNKHLVNTVALSLLLLVCFGLFLPLSVLRRGCVPCSQYLPIPPLACATLHLQGIKSEPPESTEKKDKKIGPNENQKHRLFPRLSLSLPLSPPSHPPPSFCHELGKTREKEN